MAMEYESYLNKEHGKVGAMVRHMAGDYGRSFKDFLRRLYSEDDGSVSEIGETCVFWHWNIVRFSPDPYYMRKYISIVQTAFDYGIDLNKIRAWKQLLRVIMPEEFFATMKQYTQVPQIAARDDTIFEEKKDTGIVDSTQFNW